jgi:hypothetical protein
MLWLWMGLAQAAPHGMVVHLNLATPATGTVVVKLTGENEDRSVEMRDDGVSPDVTAGDAMYSGTTLVQVDTVKVSVVIGDKTIEGGNVSWETSQSTCDLNLKLEGENLSAEAAVPSPPVPQQPSAGSAPPTTPTGAPAAAAPPTSSSLAPPVASDNSGAVSMVVGAAVLLLAGLLYLGWSGSGGSLLPSLPEPGLLGPQTPSLSEGLSRWETAPEDTAALTRILLATMARHHRVLLIAPPDFQPDPVFGGPVYRAPSRPGSWKKVLNGLLEEGGLPLTVLCLGGSVGALTKMLPDGVGGIMVGGGDEKLPTVKCTRDGARWHLQTETGMLLLAASTRGFDEGA